MQNLNLWNNVVKPLIIEQYKYASNWKACLKAVIDMLQRIEDGAFALLNYFQIPQTYNSSLTSKHLDFIASLVGLKRNEGENDETFYTRFMLYVVSSDAGTPSYVIRNVKVLSGNTSPSYNEEAPATFYVYTAPHKQLRQAEVKRLSPVGVLGFAAAALLDANGNFIVNANDEKIMCVADDNKVGTGNGYILLKDSGYILLRDGGRLSKI